INRRPAKGASRPACSWFLRGQRGGWRRAGTSAPTRAFRSRSLVYAKRSAFRQSSSGKVPFFPADRPFSGAQLLDDYPLTLDVDRFDEAVGFDEDSVAGDIDQEIADPRLACGAEHRGGPPGLAN